MQTLSYRARQDLFREVSLRASLDQDFRKLCLDDSKAALESVKGRPLQTPCPVRFLEEDGVEINVGELAFVLPTFLKKTWLSD